VCQTLQYLARISDANNNQIFYVALVLDNKNTLTSPSYSWLMFLENVCSLVL